MEIIFIDDKSDGTVFTLTDDIHLEAMHFPPAVRSVYWNKPCVDMSVFGVDEEHMDYVYLLSKETVTGYSRFNYREQKLQMSYV